MSGSGRSFRRDLFVFEDDEEDDMVDSVRMSNSRRSEGPSRERNDEKARIGLLPLLLCLLVEADVERLVEFFLSFLLVALDDCCCSPPDFLSRPLKRQSQGLGKNGGGIPRLWHAGVTSGPGRGWLRRTCSNAKIIP
jgi:hypothetical protein